MTDVQSVQELEFFEFREGYGYYCPEGNVSLHQATRLVTKAIGFARHHGIGSMLVNVSKLTGFDSPNLGERYWFIKDWAQEASGLVRLAVVARPEMIDPHKIGVVMAANAGLVSNVFSKESEAIEWLVSKQRR
jgi:hypothetical protein